MSTLAETTCAVLALSGAEVEMTTPDHAAVVAPAAVQQALGIAEYAELDFSGLPHKLPHDGAVSFGLQPGRVQALERLLGGRGCCRSGSLASHDFVLKEGQALRAAERALSFTNATYRLRGEEAAECAYLFTVVRYTAVSDEKREGVVEGCLNESNQFAADHILPGMRALLHEQAERTLQPWAQRSDAALEAPLQRLIKHAIVPRVRTEMRPFVQGMERRMQRDLDRLCDYHSGLRQEQFRRMRRKLQSGDGDAALDELKLRATEREYVAKVADLERKYAIKVSLEVLQAARVLLPVLRVKLALLCRKHTRELHLDWSPLSRRLDALSCEGCGACVPTFQLCEGRLHIICPACLAHCQSCGRQSCRICAPRGCAVCRGR